MAYWWLNQNEDEIDFWDDDLIVVPRRDKLGKTSASYATAAEMKPGDLGFAFVGGDLESVFAVIGAPEDEVIEMGADGQRRPARLVAGRFFDLNPPLPFESLSTMLRGVLPMVGSPLDPQGQHKETSLRATSPDLAERLKGALLRHDPLIGGALGDAMHEALGAGNGDEAAFEALVSARAGVGKFGDDVLALWDGACAATGSRERTFIQVTPIKPWVLATDEERLDPQNGLPLTPTWYGAFIGGLVAFADDGSVLLDRGLDPAEVAKAGIDPAFRLPLKGERQAAYLAAHRAALFDG